jgi:hypothetical protein
MPAIEVHSVFANAYHNGRIAGEVFIYVLLLAVAFQLVQRLRRGSSGPGFRRSPMAAVLGLVVVAALALSSFTRGGDDMKGARASIVAGCTSQGATARVCGCYADQLLERTDNDSEKFAALEHEMVVAHKAGRAMPAPVRESVAACVVPAPDAPKS